jgi:hypothetical protein
MSKTTREPGYECFHCKQWILKGDTTHDCWTTTEEALTKDLPEDLREAWERIRETAVEFGEQRVYASLRSIMFAKKVCYLFVRPRPKRLEVVFFLGRPIKSPLIRRIDTPSKVKFSHMVHIVHRDEIEAPLTDWMREAYDVSETLRARPKAPPAAKPARKAARTRRQKKR